jgi:hypothetical protein
MRGTRIGLLAGSGLSIVIGVLSLVWVAVDRSMALAGGIMAGSFLLVGVVLYFSARYVGSLDTSDILRDGTPGTAEVLSTQDTGVTINNLNLVVRLKLRVTVPGRAPHEVSIRHVLSGRNMWAAIQPGMVLPIRVDPRNPNRVAVDFETANPVLTSPVMTGLAVAGPAGVGGPGMLSAMAAGDGVDIVRVTGADIVAAGVPTTGQVVSVQPLGVTAGQLTPGLPADQADDPVVHVVFTYAGPGGEQRRKEAMIRVPDGKLGVLVPGRPVAVSYLAQAPETATIDWLRT